MSVTQVSAVSISQLTENFLNSKYYRLTREIQNNTILNRATIELLGADVPTTLTELVGRNWKTAAEVFFRISLFLVTSFFVPLLFVPFLNKQAASKFNLPKEFNKHFLNQFEDLIPEKDTNEGNDDFRQKIINIEGEDKVKKAFGDSCEAQIENIRFYKQNLIKAKAEVVKKDILYTGLLTYSVGWIQNWFSKHVLGVVGYTGETTYLSESQQEESSSFHEKTKYIKFAIGLLPTFFGSNWYSDKVFKATTSKDEELKDSKFLSFIKKHISQFDYYKEKYARKLNLAGAFLFGGDLGFMLAVRSLNEAIERSLRLAVFWPTMFYGVEWVNAKLAENSDKKQGTQIVDQAAPKEFNIPKVRMLGELEKEIKTETDCGNTEKASRILKSMKNQAKYFWQSILLDSLIMGVGLTSANIIGTKIRVSKGIY